MRILITGGLGYIGRHTIVELYKRGHEAIILDNCSNAPASTLNVLESIVGKTVRAHIIDVCDREELLALELPPVDIIIHMCGKKYVSESIADPISYYKNNVTGLLNVIELARQLKCKSLIFSSSATVYPPTATVPVSEEVELPRAGTSPYGTSKLMCEQILRDLVVAEPTWKIAALRYFNPAGNLPTGQLGDCGAAGHANLFGAIIHAVSANRTLSVYGGDYDTRDGSPVRDFIHVYDLAEAHVRVADLLCGREAQGLLTLNIGRGEGITVFEVIAMFREKGCNIAYKIVPRRQGDIPISYTDTTKMRQLLNWTPTRTLEQMVLDTLASH